MAADTRSSESGVRVERTITGVPEGLDALVLAQLVAEAQKSHAPGRHLHVARDDRRLDALEQALAFFAPQVRVISFPAWDTVPYDRIGPHADIVARRITALAKLALSTPKHPTVVLTTVNAILQRVPPRDEAARAGPAPRHGAADAVAVAHGLCQERDRHGSG
jgi:transcription-repair coupling factor (superfamily II helicase)